MCANLNDVIGISICDFELWPRNKGYAVPMLSRRRMQEQETGMQGTPRLVFLEIPKYDRAREPRTAVEKWAYFFRETVSLTAIPEALAHPPVIEALEAARIARFTISEWDAYIAAGMAIQNARGALFVARREGYEQGLEWSREQGLVEGLRIGIEALCGALGIELSVERTRELQALDAPVLEALLAKLRAERRWP